MRALLLLLLAVGLASPAWAETVEIDLGGRMRLKPWIGRLSRLAELKGAIRVPVFLIANPDESGGGGGAIRPLLRASLDKGESLSVFLGKALERWRTLAPR